MDPCPFFRIMVGNLVLNIPVASKASRSGVHPSPASCFCKIKLKSQRPQMSAVPLVGDQNTTPSASPSAVEMSLTLAASFDLSKSEFEKLAAKSMFVGRKTPAVKMAVYAGSMGASCSRGPVGTLVGKVSVPVELKGADEGRARFLHDGWVSLGKGKKEGDERAPAVHVTVMLKPDPRFVFEFDGEPECSPQVFQVRGSMRQPIFTCRFTLRSPSVRSPSLRRSSSKWLRSLGSVRERVGKERKGWAVTVHDLSGSAVAFASMVTPFVASSAGSDCVDRSNPGAWLIFLPGDGTWKSWGRLEAWRARGAVGDELGCRFELVPADNNNNNMGCGLDVVLAETTLSAGKGGKFCIDLTGNKDNVNINDQARSLSASPVCSLRFGTLQHGYRGFVMSSTVQGEGKCSKPVVEIGVQSVGCAEDAAAFVALAAAVDLSMDACKPFSHRLRSEFDPDVDVTPMTIGI